MLSFNLNFFCLSSVHFWMSCVPSWQSCGVLQNMKSSRGFQMASSARLWSPAFFLSFRYGQTSTNWRFVTRGCGCAGSAECVTKGSRCRCSADLNRDECLRLLADGSRVPFTTTGGVPQIQFTEIDNPWIVHGVVYRQYRQDCVAWKLCLQFSGN